MATYVPRSTWIGTRRRIRSGPSICPVGGLDHLKASDDLAEGHAARSLVAIARTGDGYSATLVDAVACVNPGSTRNETRYLTRKALAVQHELLPCILPVCTALSLGDTSENL